jgi:polysaccharide pyruvyl transferase WcaK-like protein
LCRDLICKLHNNHRLIIHTALWRSCGLRIAYPRTVHVLAAGAYGYGNFGDDCYVDILQSRLAGYQLDILSRIDEAELKLHSYDASMLAGGGVLYQSLSENGANSLKHYLRYPAIAQWLGKKSFMLGIGVQGPIQTQTLTPYLSVFEGMNLRTVRDNFSARLLRGAGVVSPVMECADLLYGKAIYPKQQGRRVPGKPVLGIVASQPGENILHPRFEGFESRIQQALRILEKDFRLHFFSFDDRSDPWLQQSWTGNHSYSNYDPSQPDAIHEFIRAFENVDVFVTTRYHGVVLSVLTGTPFLAIGSPAEKVQRECDAIRHPYFLSYDSSTERIALSALEVWAERRELRELIRSEGAQRRKLALRNFELLFSEHTNAGENRTQMISKLVEATRNSSSSRTLVIWAAGSECWSEAGALFDQLRDFDCLFPPRSPLRHTSIGQRILLPEPGIFNWLAFPKDLKNKLGMNYGNVIVCHAAAERKTIDLHEIASRSGRCIWEFDVWNHSLQHHSILKPQGVIA